MNSYGQKIKNISGPTCEKLSTIESSQNFFQIMDIQYVKVDKKITPFQSLMYPAISLKFA